MLSHFLKIFVRTSARSAGYTIINVSGLAIGLASSIFIMLWVWDEINFDTQHEKRDRVYQIMFTHTYPDGAFNDVATTGKLAGALRDFPEVEESCRFTDDRVLMQAGDKSIYENGIYGDASMFKILTIPVVSGTASLDDNNSIVLSQKLADKYFPGEDANGKNIRVNGNEFKVTGVFRNNPSNSSFKFDFVLPYSVYAKMDQYNEEWGAWTGGNTLVLLQPGTDIAALTDKITSEHVKPRIWVRWDKNVEVFLFPLTDLRLYGDTNMIQYVRIFGIVGIFLLVIACINFMNLATARSINRSKEIGVRKVAGAARRSLIGQFFSESVLIAFIALVFALITVQLLLPTFNILTGKEVSLNFTIIGMTLIITVMTGIMAGMYPAFLLSSVKPVLALKGKFKGVGGANIRKALVIFQFSMSTILIVCAAMAHLQIQYMKNKDLGFDRDNIVYFPASKNIMKSYDAFRNAALANPAIVSVAEGRFNPMRIQNGMVLNDTAWPGKTAEDNIVFRWMHIDENYLETLGLKLVAGRNFSKENASDTLNFIVNEEAVRQMKLKDPIGAKLVAPHEGKIIGVVKDFNSLTLQAPMQAIILANARKIDHKIFVRYQNGKAAEVVGFLTTLYKSMESEFPMEYKFMDEPFGEMYANEILIERLSMYFTIIAVFISCLGLFGLASFTAESRTKEIGVRKVLGASASQIVTLLWRDFVWLILASLVIGFPIGWWSVDKYLSAYAFHTEISWWVFACILVGMIGITFISVGYQSAKAALANPARTLRTE
ncbi:MAG TPA: ABC transporter permease [Cyclobacteriaceae bacterium]|nr:ABC transporter permease [Cyclobacteriaceae bacterium]